MCKYWIDVVDTEFFNLADREEVLLSDDEFDNREDAEKYCVNNDREQVHFILQDPF